MMVHISKKGWRALSKAQRLKLVEMATSMGRDSVEGVVLNVTPEAFAMFPKGLEVQVMLVG